MSLSNLGRSLAQSAPAVRPRRLRISNSVSRSVMTWDRIRLLVREGFGHGRGEAYIPWIRVTRGLSSPVSHPTVAHTPIHVRGVHLLSGLEDEAARVAAWLGAREIREQFPLFPWAGVHPMHGLDPDRDRVLDPAPAMSDIVSQAGVKLRRYIGSSVPYVATTDLVLRLGDYPVYKPESEWLVFLTPDGEFCNRAVITRRGVGWNEAMGHWSRSPDEARLAWADSDAVMDSGRLRIIYMGSSAGAVHFQEVWVKGSQIVSSVDRQFDQFASTVQIAGLTFHVSNAKPDSVHIAYDFGPRIDLGPGHTTPIGATNLQ